MNQKPEKLEKIWTEKELCERLDLRLTASGRSQKLTNWILDGLGCVEKSGKRYFFEQDVIDYLWSKYTIKD